MASSRRSPPIFSRSIFLPLLLLVCVSILAFVMLIQPWSLRQTSLPLRVGDVAPQDLRASRDIQYVSDILSEQARTAAERAVEPIYAPPDPAVARGQIDKLKAILQSITDIRSDSNSTSTQKMASLAVIQGVSLQPSSIETILAISDSRWQAVQSETLNVLEKVMQAPIRSDGVDEVRQNLPSQVSFAMTENESGVIVDLVQPLVTANSFYSPELTAAARQAAGSAVQPVIQSFVKDQTIVAGGQIISDADLEALTELGMVQPKTQAFTYLGAAALVGLSALIMVLYAIRRKREFLTDLRSLILLSMLFLIFLLGARVSIPDRTILPYLFPIAAFGLLVSALFGIERGVVFSLIMSALAAYGMPDSLGLLPYYLLSSLCGVFALGQAHRLSQFLYAGVAIAGGGAAVLAAYRLPFTSIDWIGIATLAGAALLNGIASTSIALPLLYLLAQFLDMTTPLQLLEISRPDHPLLNYFLQRAPGTYQHCLQVANIAEQAAERIQADVLLTRVGALFHDVGKSANPLFFIENQPPNHIDTHDDLDPEVSAQIIIRHVSDGLELARKYRLPRRIRDFITEHHGTQITRYQYNRALQDAGGEASRVEEGKFRYPGPSPRSKETAILMLADGVEARARAERPSDDSQMRGLIQDVINRCQKDGQLDDTPLLQRELAAIAESFLNNLRVTYHPRLEYPQEKTPAGPPAADDGSSASGES
ncbi:MAG: HDIG domain-containing metalloprotein [Anaerolineales bacterium]|jgi:putative nucleotidyltransferase with HDIG domain